MPELNHIIHELPEASRSWWLAAMRQDATIWQAVLSAEKLPELATRPIETWSPAMLALAALKQPPDPLPLHKLAPIESRLRLNAGRTFERLTQPRSNLTPELQNDLTEVGYLAFALRERRRLIGGWDGLRAELRLASLNTWRTPLACLFGMIPDPQALLAALIELGDQPDWNTLALHALLSNPLAPVIQAELLGSILPANAQLLLEQLAIWRPTLARTLATYALKASPTNLGQNMATIAALAGDPQAALDHLGRAGDVLQRAQAALHAQTADLMSRFGLADAGTAQSYWRQAVELDPEQPAYWAGLAHTLLDDGQIVEAANTLQASLSQHDHPEVRFALARLASESGDHERARHLAIQCLQSVEQNDFPAHKLAHLADLGQLLLELGRPQLAAQAAEQALKRSPADSTLLALLAQARFAANDRNTGMDSLHLASRLDPENLSLRRQYATRLESCGDWPQALAERIAIAGGTSLSSDQPSDLVTLAACALHAGQPQISVEACQRALTINPDDGNLHALFGEALVHKGADSAACEHFNAATLLSPGLPAPWLALAQIYQQAGESQKALETLRAAAQSAQQCVEIHLALGEAYLAANAPTPALECLRQAAAIQPEHERLPLPLAQALHHLGYLEEARRVIEKSNWEHSGSALSEAHPTTKIELAYTYAQVLLALGDLPSALSPLRIVVETSPADAAPYLDYACTLLTLRQDLPEAIESLRHVISIAPQQITAHAFLAEALAASGDLLAAHKAYQAALESDLARDALWRGRLAFGLGETALALKQTDTAIAALHEANQCDPYNTQVYHKLADAYLQAGLAQNALQAMRAALQVSQDNLAELLWFANKAQAMAGDAENGEGQRHLAVLTEAIQALHQAIRIAPQSTELRLHLATIYLQQQEATSARAALRELLELEFAPAADLQQAARLLLDPLQDPPSAIACLEKALNNASETQLCDLLSDLAHAHHRAGDQTAALLSIERALEVDQAAPEILAELRRVKAQLLCDLNRPDDALGWIKIALTAQPGDAILHQLAADYLRRQGQLAAALEHIEQALLGPCSTQIHILGAELARAMLQFEHACAILQTAETGDSNLSALDAELALEIGTEIDAANALTRAIENTHLENLAASPLRSRLLALQARLTMRRGDASTAVDLYQQACETSSASEQVAASAQYALAAAAFDLEDWDNALNLARQSAAQNVHEPYAAYQLARTLARRAETQRLCDAAQSIRRAPGLTAIAPTARREFERTIRRAKEQISKTANRSGRQTATGNDLLCEWERRGKEAFKLPGGEQQSEQPYQTISRLLALAESMPADALVGAQEFATQNDQETHPAILHYLMAWVNYHANHLPNAADSIQAALTLWPDEPRWYALAAEISLENDDALRAVEHAEQSVSLEGQRATHHLVLGQALLALQTQHNDPAALVRRALQSLEQATHLDPNLPEAWYALAHAHLQSGDLRQAAASAECAANLAPEQAEYLLLCAQIALHNNEPAEALLHAQSALNIQPERHTALLLAARALQALDRSDEALSLLDQFADQPQHAHNDPSTESGHESHPPEKLLVLQLERVHALALSHGAQNALAAATALAENHPNHPAVLAALAHLQADSGERENAIRNAQTAVQISKAATQPDRRNLDLEADLHHLLGDLLRRAGQLDQAVYHLNQAVHLNPQALESYLDLGQAQQERRQYHQALSAYQQAIAIAPRDPRPYLQAGLALKDGKSYLEAEEMLRRAAELSPKDVSIRRQLAAVIALNLVHNRRNVGAEAAYFRD